MICKNKRDSIRACINKYIRIRKDNAPLARSFLCVYAGSECTLRDTHPSRLCTYTYFTRAETPHFLGRGRLDFITICRALGVYCIPASKATLSVRL